MGAHDNVGRNLIKDYVTLQSRVARGYEIRGDAKARWFPGLGVWAVRLES